MFDGSAIKKKRKELKLSANDLALKLGVNMESIYKWEKGHKPSDPEQYIRLKNWLDDKLENVPYETSENGSEAYLKTRQRLKNTSDRKRAVPFYDAEAVGGIAETDMTPIHAPAGTIDVGDLLHDSKAAIRIYGNSMLPNYPPGCVLGLAPAESSFIEPGEVYVIETSTRRIFKRLFYKDDNPESNKLTLYSDNIMKFEGGARHGKLAYPPYDIPKEEIKRIFVVTGVIKRNANSVIINREI